MRRAQATLHLTRRISALLLTAGLLLPVTCLAWVVKNTAGRTPSAPVRMAQATGGQAPACTASPSSATITIPSPISIAPGTSNGKIGNPASVTVSIDCNPAFLNTPNYYDNFTALAGQLAALDPTNAPPGGQGIMLQTNLSGIDVLLKATPTQASSGTGGPNGTPGWPIKTINCDTGKTPYCTFNPVSATFTAQLVKTGPVSPGTISSIQILQFFDSDFSPLPPNGQPANTIYTSASASYGTLTLNAVTVSMSTCNVTSQLQNFTVTLPKISTSALKSTNSVAGQTPFNIQYSCPSGWSLYMTMSTTTPGPAPGVILPPAFCPAGAPATNVGVQLLQGNQQAVNFNVAQTLGNSPNGTLTIPYYAQYYATGSPVGSGPICATATFTMSYN
jgi:type 1 fimbria pilin